MNSRGKVRHSLQLQLSYTLYLRAFCFRHGFHHERCCTRHSLKRQDKHPVHIPLLHHKKRLAHPGPPGHSQLVMQHRVLPMDQPSLTHHTERDGRAHHWENNTRSSYATDGEWRLRVINRLAQPQSRSGEKLTSSRISLLSCTKNLSGLRGSLVDDVPQMDDSERKEVEQ